MRTAIKSLIAHLATKPWNSPFMETQYGLWRGVSALTSDSGRQLGEENTRPFLLNRHVPADTIICKYDGSRAGHSINMSALRIAMANFDEALQITGAVGQYHMARAHSANPEKKPGIWDLYLISKASIGLIAYQQRQKNAARPQSSSPVSDALASQYQFISGIFMICRSMIREGHQAISGNGEISASELYSYADENSIFMSPNEMACAGSPRKIMEFLEFCVDLNAANTDLSPASNKADSANSPMQAYVDNPEQWYEYALATEELNCFIEQEYHRQHAQSRPEDSGRQKHIQQIYAELAVFCHFCMNNPPAPKTENFANDVLQRQNHILKLLGRSPIRTAPAQYFQKRYLQQRLTG